MGLKEENAKLLARIDALTETVTDLLRRLDAKEAGLTTTNSEVSAVTSAKQHGTEQCQPKTRPKHNAVQTQDLKFVNTSGGVP